MSINNCTKAPGKFYSRQYCHDCIMLGFDLGDYILDCRGSSPPRNIGSIYSAAKAWRSVPRTLASACTLGLRIN